LAYNIYGAILETVTGKTWQDWLDDGVLDPLGLERTSARTSDFDLGDQAWSHIWTETGWFEVRPKTDAQMQSAGGMTMSPADMGVWLQTQLRGEGPAGSGLTADIIADAQAPAAITDPATHSAVELPCSGYALGWNICDFEGHTLYVHGGGYTGARTMMAFSPDLGVGIGVFSNSDNMTGWLTSRTTVMFLQFVIDHEDAERWVEIRQRTLSRTHRMRLLNQRGNRVDGTRAQDVWGGWSWAPEASALSEFEGVYASEAIYAPIRIEAEGHQLTGAWGDLPFTLEPASEDLFGAAQHPLDPPSPVRFERDADGAVVAVIWEGQRAEKR
jgi:CubicO group peptidase (beta-lactamase class C family)